MDYKELKDFKLSDAIQFHDKLNPNIWRGQHPQPDVKKQLILIAKDFIEELGIKDLDVKDVTVSGSNAAYSYTPNSDLDLHILVDMSNMPNDEVYKELFQAKKTIYNDSHDVKVHGVPVELYVQDASEPVVSLGEYSLLKDKWIRIPTKRRANFDQTATKAKYEKLKDLALLALKSKEYTKVKKLLDTIKRYRQAGLDKGGEFGPENLAYKALRAEGFITKLFALRDKLHSQKLSIESMYEAPVLDKPTPTISQLVDKHKVSREHILDQLVKGIQVEYEHTSSSKQASEIALDHIEEDPNYYTKLKDAKLEEYVEWNTLNRDYKNEKQVGKLLLKAEGGSAGRLHVKAYDMSDSNNPVEAGFADFAIRTTEDGEDYLRAYYTYVHHKYRGKGIAKQMYLFVNEIGNDIKPSELQTDLGKDMWKGLSKVVRQPGGIKKQEPDKTKQSGWQKFKNLFKMTEQEQAEYDKPIVYLDMDGVLADFNNKYIELFGKGPDINSKDDPNLTKMIGSDFFATLDKLPGADLLIDNIVKLFGSYSICSSPLRYDHKNSEENKKKWIQQHLNPQPKFVVITGKKDSYAKGKNILIDDKPKNINAWRARGGIGILYDAYKDNVNDVIKELKQIATKLDEDIPVTQGPTQKQRTAAISKTQPKLGGGYFGKVYDQPESELGIGTAKKISRFDQNKPTLDGYYAYINRLMSLKDQNDNPYLPQIYNANVIKPKRGAPYFELDMEKLSPWTDLSEDELLTIFSRALDVEVNSMGQFSQLVGRKGIPPKDTIMHDLLRYMTKTLKDPNHKDIKGNSIKDPQLIEAINIIRYLEKTGYGEDLHAGNIMVRRTKYGPQLVLTDPLSFGSQAKMDQVEQGKIRVNTIGVTVPPDYFVYVYDKFNNNAVEIVKMYGSSDEIKKEVHQKYDPYWYDVEIIANDRKLDNPAQPPKPRKATTGSDWVPVTSTTQKQARNKQHSPKKYVVYDQPHDAPPWKTKKMLGDVVASSENEALRLARQKFQNVPPHKISVMIDLLGSDFDKKIDEEDDYSIEAREIDKKLKAAGYKKIGAGAEAAVYIRDQGSVIKILMPDLEDMKDLNKDFYNAEKTFIKFYNFVKQNKGNPFLPKFIPIQGKDYARFKIGDRTFLQISMEQLYPYKKNGLEEAIIWAFSEFAASKMSWSEVEDTMGDPETFEYFGDNPQQYYFKAKHTAPKKFAKAWQTIAMTDKNKLNYYHLLYETMATLYKYGRANNMGWDLHTENVMRRKDGTLVITDPFYGFINNMLNEVKALEDYDPNGPPPGPEFKPTMPAGTVRVDVSDVYDWYKLGQHISNMKGLGKHDFGKGPPSTILSFGDEDTEHQYIQDLEKTGLTTTDIDPIDKNQPKGMKRQKTDPTYNVNEALDKPYKLKWYPGDWDEVTAYADIPDGDLTIIFNNDENEEGEEAWSVEFYRNNSQEITGEGDAQRIFATVLSAIQTFIKKYKPNRIIFSASKEVEPGQKIQSRANLYDRLVQRYAKAMGYKAFRADAGNKVHYELSKINKGVAEGAMKDLDYDIQDEQWEAIVGYVINGLKKNMDLDRIELNLYKWGGKELVDVDQVLEDRGFRDVAELAKHIKDNNYKYVPPTDFGLSNIGKGLQEASGYIPSEKEKNDPRFKTALTVDVKPDSIKKNAKAFGSKISRAGIPPLLRP